MLASCADTAFTFGGLLALNNLLDGASPPPNVISMSYGECEPINGAASNAAFKSVYQQAVAEGVSVFVSSGDEGGASCDANAASATHGIAVSGFASTPNNVAVGGTDFGDTVTSKTSTYWSTHNSATFASALSYVPEIPWNDSCASVLFSGYFHYPKPYGSSGYCNSSEASGNQQITTGCRQRRPERLRDRPASTAGIVSGECRGDAKPSWQQSLFGVPDDGVRDIPDVSLFAANGYWGHYYIYCDLDPDDGTSCRPARRATGRASAAPRSPRRSWQAFRRWSMRSGAIRETRTRSITRSRRPNTARRAAPLATRARATRSAPPAPSTTSPKATSTSNCSGPGCYDPGGPYGVLSTAGSAGYAPAFAARAGWDFATGIGSVNAANLVNNTAWSAARPRSARTPPHTGAASSRGVFEVPATSPFFHALNF